MSLKVKLVHANAQAPVRMSNGAAGYDLFAAESVVIPPRSIGKVNTGICVTVPHGTYGRIAPRSSLALKGIDVGAGVVDSDYLGVVQVVLYNHSDAEKEIKSGERCAQLILECISICPVEVVESLDPTERGTGGFGSTNQIKL